MSDVTEAKAGPATGEMTVDELARRAQMTVRNVRAHQSRGLLPAPEVRARTGYYNEEHLQRLRLISELQSAGLNLKAVKRALEGGLASAPDEALDFTHALVTAFGEEEPEVVTESELEKEWGQNPDLLKKVERLGLVTPLGGGTWEVRSPRLRRASLELAELGISPEKAVRIVKLLQDNSKSIARAYVDLFLKEVWRPFQEKGEPAEGWPEVTEALERLRPLASQSLVAVFEVVMSDAVEKSLGRELKRLASGSDKRR